MHALKREDWYKEFGIIAQKHFLDFSILTNKNSKKRT